MADKEAHPQFQICLAKLEKAKGKKASKNECDKLNKILESYELLGGKSLSSEAIALLVHLT